MRTLTITALILVAMLLASLKPAECGSCGIVPVKPVVPVGCRDLKPVCVCDEKGKNCKWQWQCVK